MTLHAQIDKIVFSILGFISHLISIAAYLVSVVFRIFVDFLLDKKKYRLIETGIATIMAGETKGPVNVLYVLKCTGTPNKEKIVEKLYKIVEYETKLTSGGETETPYRPFEKLRYVIVEKFGTFCWTVDHSFRAEDHLVMDKVEKSLDVEIQKRCERLLDTFHSNDRPQWEMHVIHRNDPKEYAVIWSVHHSYGDATIFTQTIRYALADDPFPIKIDPLEWNRKPKTFRDTIQNIVETVLLCTIGSGWFADIYGRCLGQSPVKENSLTERRGRNHCRAVPFDLTALKSIHRKLCKESSVRLISLLYAFVAPAFERAISSSKLEKPSTILASTVEANYPYNSLELCINVLTLWFELPLNIKSRQERLRIIDARIRDVTGHLGMSLFKIGTNLIGTVTAPIARLLEKTGSLTHSTYISNIVGPQDYFTVFGGDSVTSMYVYSPISIEEVVTVVAYTYGDEITLALVAPDRVIKKLPRFFDDFIAGIKDEMDKFIDLSKTK